MCMRVSVWGNVTKRVCETENREGKREGKKEALLCV